MKDFVIILLSTVLGILDVHSFSAHSVTPESGVSTNIYTSVPFRNQSTTTTYRRHQETPRYTISFRQKDLDFTTSASPTSGAFKPETFFHCLNNIQVIKNSQVCDGVKDCTDESDEINCPEWIPKIIKLPEQKIDLECSDLQKQKNEDLILECEFVGYPKPAIKWKKYDGHVPSKCQQLSKNGHGILKCPNFQQSDQGAYSCVAENEFGSSESQPKSYARCKGFLGCNGFTVVNEEGIQHCLDCYCSGKTRSCRAIQSSLTTKQISFPSDIVKVTVNNDGQVVSIPSSATAQNEIEGSKKKLRYCSLSEQNLKETSFLKSYGRFVKIPRYEGKVNFRPRAPVIIMRGNEVSLMYTFKRISHYSPIINVRFWPGNWHYLNETAAARKDIMKVLSNVDTFLIRCEYKEGKVEEWSGIATIVIESSSITGFNNSVSYVEKCDCPQGYAGLSCESCASGYKTITQSRDFRCEKIYVPPPKCDVGSYGDKCDKCNTTAGYHRNGTKCVKATCNPDGSTSLFTNSFGMCTCREGVTGKTCDTCMKGYFNLYKFRGCTKCWCNGVTDKCRSSKLYKTDISRTSLGGYNSSDGRNFWLLSSEFGGNRLTSYGGHLNYTLKYVPNIPKQLQVLTVEILSVDDVTLTYKHPKIDSSTNKNEKLWSVVLKEDFWQKDNKSLKTRGEFLSILSKIKAVYVQSPYHLASGQVNLTFARMSDASSSSSGELALDVEECECPEGYTGLSCESCSKGYYKNKTGTITKCVKCDCENCDPEKGCQVCPSGMYQDNPQTEELVICKKCPCNDNEIRCEKIDYDQIFCMCKKEFTGLYCEVNSTQSHKSHLLVAITPSRVKNQKSGTRITFKCSYNSTEKMKIVFSRKYDPGLALAYQTQDSFFDGIQYGSEKTTEITLDADLKDVYCTVYDENKKVAGHVRAVIEDTIITVKSPKITSCYDEKVQVKESESTDLICEATGVPTPTTTWYTTTGKLDTIQGVHSIESATLGQNGTIFTCVAENMGGRSTCTVMLIVEAKCDTVTITPQYLKTREGEPIHLECRSTANSTLNWSRQGLALIPNLRTGISIFQSVSNLTITNTTVHDSGMYTCKTVVLGKEISKTIEVVVQETDVPPVVTISDGDVKLKIGDYYKVNCTATGKPTPSISWKKIGAGFFNIVGGTLVIKDAKEKDSGLYQCEAKSRSGNDTRLIYIEVQGVKPLVQIKPNSLIKVIEGDHLRAHCEVRKGSPKPTLKWFKAKSRQSNYGTVKSGYYVSSDPVLEFKNISRHDSGKYQCQASNQLGTNVQDLDVDVLVPPRISISKKEIVGFENENITIECNATGHPKPNIVWSKYETNTIMNNKRVELSRQGKITVVLAPDLLGLTCSGVNEAGNDSQTVMVQRKKPPAGKEGGQEFVERVLIGTEYVLVCLTSSGKGNVEKENGHLQGDECNTAIGLTIPSVQLQHSGKYLCKSQQNNRTEKIITLMVAGYTVEFSQPSKSYLILPIILKSPEELRVEITFKIKRENGLLLLKQNNEFGLYVKDRRLNLRLHPDKEYINQTSFLKFHIHSNYPLQFDTWYTVSIVVMKNEITMKIYGQFSLELESKTEKLRESKMNFGLHLRDNFFVGGSKHRVNKHGSFFSYLPALDGCVSRLFINNHEHHMTGEGIYSKNVASCNVCMEKDNPCKGSGKCLDAPTQYGFVCVCPLNHTDKGMCPESCTGRGCHTQMDLCKLMNPCRSENSNTCSNLKSHLECNCSEGYLGTTCEKVKKMSFCVEGNGYVRLPSTMLKRTNLKKPEQIKIIFRSKNPDGQLLWQGDKKNYLSIAVRKGQLEYIYFNQNLELKVTGKPRISNTPNAMQVIRNNNTAVLQIKGELFRNFTTFSTNRVVGDIYLGNAPNISLGYDKPIVGLNGCIHSLSLDGTDINFAEMNIKEVNTVSFKDFYTENESYKESYESDNYSFNDSEYD